MNTTVQTTCYHCGEDCDKTLHYHNKSFCCEGCKTVYDILHSEGLDSYYTIEKTPGTRVNTHQRYAYLEHEEIQQQLLEFNSDDVQKVTLFVPHIHCSSCIWLLEQLHRLHEGITHAETNFVKKEVSITYCPKSITLRQVVELMATIGYAPEINLASGKKEKKQYKRLYYQLGIAGFCFGNIMLLSLPEYLGMEAASDPIFTRFFSYLNLLLALPVLLYSSSHYFASAVKSFRHKHISIDVPIVLGITALFAESAYQIISQTGPGYMDSLAGLVFFLLIGKWYQQKTYQALSFERDYKSYFPMAVTHLNQEGEEELPLEHLQVGYRILIRHGDLIPADSTLVKGEGNIDYSFVTGESTPVIKKTGDYLYSGGKQVGGPIEVVVEKPVEQSYLTRLWNNTTPITSPTDTLVSKVSKYFTLVILAVAALTALYWWWADPSMIVKTVTAVLIVACPCALALAAPFTFGTVIRVFGNNGLYLKNSHVVEKMAATQAVVFDKTGTITTASPSKVDYVGIDLSEQEWKMLKTTVRNATHPLSRAIYKYMQHDSDACILNFEEVVSRGIRAELETGVVQLGSQQYITGKSSTGNATRVFLSIDGEVKGFFELMHEYRKGWEEAFNALHHFELHLLSGDNDKDRKRLQPYFHERLHFDQTPENKLEYIAAMQHQGKQVMMVGDGLNDAGALQQSNVGIALADDVYRFSPACDGILDAKRFEFLPVFMQFSKKGMQVVRISFMLSFVYNIIGLSFAISGHLTPLVAAILMPVSSITVVAFVSFAVRYLARKNRL